MSSTTQSAIIARSQQKPKATLRSKPAKTSLRVGVLSVLTLALFTTIFANTSTYAAETSDSITTNLNITVIDSSLEVPKTGFSTEIFGGKAGVMPTIVLPIIAPVVLAAILFIMRKVVISRRSRLSALGTAHGSASYYSSSKCALRTAKTAAILLTVASLVITNIPTNYTSAAEPEDKLITLSLTDLLGAIQVEKGTTLTEAAKLNLSITTASINDIDIEVAFTSSNPGIELSTLARTVTLPAGTTSTAVPVDVKVSNEVEAGKYAEPVEISVTIQDTFWRTEGRDVINRHGIKTRLNAMNLFTPGTPPWDNEYPEPQKITTIPNDFAFAEMESLGINALRLNFSPRLIADYCTTSACLTYDYSEEIFAQLDQVLQHAANHNIGIFFNFHNSYGTIDGTPANQQVTNKKYDTFLPENIAKNILVWEKIATRFKDDKRILGFELMNEPVLRIENNQTVTDAITIWNNIAQDMINAIRAIDTNHTIIVEKIYASFKNNGATRENPPSSYLFPDVSDPVSNNLILAYHDYGLGQYAQQTTDRLNTTPLVWPNSNYVGIIDAPQFNADNTIWKSNGWATYVPTASNQSTWAEMATAPQAVPAKGDNQTNIARVIVSATGEFAAGTVVYLDHIKVDQYDQANNFEKTIHIETFTHVNAMTTTATGQIVMDESVCYDAGSGCLKITGPTANSVDHVQPTRYFRIDPSKKYNISAQAHGTNATAGAPSVSAFIENSYATEETARPYDKSYLDARIKPRTNYSEEHNIPVFNTEWGLLVSGESWDKIGGEQYVQDYLEVFKENDANSAYFLYYDQNTNATQRRHGLRVREYGIPSAEPLTTNNAALNTHLYDAFMNAKD